MAVEIDTKIVDQVLNESEPTESDDSIPNWINIDFLEKHLQNFFGDKPIAIVNFDVKPATAKGENYASYLYRVTVNYSDELSTCSASRRNSDFKLSTLNIIIKTAVPGDFAFEAMSANDIYTKEIEFYKKIAPKINEALEKLNESNQLIATPYGVCIENNAILFEDLSSKGYRIASVHRGLNFDEGKIVLKKAAMIHAIHAILQQDDPHIFEHFKYGLMSRHTNVLDTFYVTQLNVMMEVVATWPNSAYYIEKLERLRCNLMEKGAKAFDAEPNQFNTLIHGDMWVNNLMMKYANETTSIENMIFIDFQYSCWTSPTIDLHYFFNNSLEESLRPSRFKELIVFYHGHLTDFLQRLKYKEQVPTLQEFHAQYLDKSFYGFIASCLIQPLMINEETAEADIEALIVGDERSLKYKRLIYSSEKVRANLRKLIPIYDSMGIFD
ncbi:uncharacterized protein LOC116347328 [Contarinia nasturtii]|uniref:uncharacterized protein LOC116347328 n=1 Tax=Contarinia nasturtii TaxID=265458 RepID=UPI0012D49AF1|nr:uncharacterized protein LOC116347328 [Contarinia nasturtii]